MSSSSAKMSQQTKKHGGKRPNSGRKRGAETKTISFRLKLDQIEPVSQLVRKYLGK